MNLRAARMHVHRVRRVSSFLRRDLSGRSPCEGGSAAFHASVSARACYARSMEERECPLCGERMHIKTRETVSKVPGTSQEVRRTTREWVCRECDNFEEIDEADGND